ncbi:helix-turn-helix domain-containing protein [Corynebacterium pseudodiphtheriticum]|uniref:helix-turn-helix domain-containing protein n=1 Tax=Corynebacterium pseudodiphtheriticum TaxID=37637 RepID=UPI0025415194|nr:helix-turn-helix domain-containing protein [Corynebacterium pseudodiphtheriticum]MDK4273747.1 helix-turn-helix domain-containing protein [Corynebacterium pseudodiphtheriticum]
MATLNTSTPAHTWAYLNRVTNGAHQQLNNLLKDHTAAEIAKAGGVYKGRAKVLNEEQIMQAREWVREGIPKAEVARRLGIGRTTLYKYLNQ